MWCANVGLWVCGWVVCVLFCFPQACSCSFCSCVPLMNTTFVFIQNCLEVWTCICSLGWIAVESCSRHFWKAICCYWSQVNERNDWEPFMRNDTPLFSFLCHQSRNHTPRRGRPLNTLFFTLKLPPPSPTKCNVQSDGCAVYVIFLYSYKPSQVTSL